METGQVHRRTPATAPRACHRKRAQSFLYLFVWLFHQLRCRNLRCRSGWCLLSYEGVEYPRRMIALIRRVLNDLLHRQDSAEAHIGFARTQPLQRLCEAVRDLAAASEPERTGRIGQGDAGPDSGDNLNDSDPKLAHGGCPSSNI